MADSAIKSISVHPLTIPMRRKVDHATSQRRLAEPIVFGVELNSHVTGYGETLPRPYVTGETIASVTEAITSVYAPLLLEMHPASFPHALEAVDALPWCDAEGTPTPAARAAVELALLDAYSRHFHRPISDAVGWMGMNEFGPSGSLRSIRHSGVLATARLATMKRNLRLMWWYGLRDFKLKVGDDGDEERLRWASNYLARASLRVDVNGAWTLADAIDRVKKWNDVTLTAIEQPLAKGDEDRLPELKNHTDVPLMHDESLISMDDAKRLVEIGVADAFNIRISKCGGLMPSLQLAYFAHKHGILIQLGCMVGETTILSAAGRKFLELVPGVQFAEGSFGALLLSNDVVAHPARFGYAGKVNAIPGYGWGIDVDQSKLAEVTTDDAFRIEF